MAEISYQELVITCEACKTVQKIPIRKYEECEALFKDYHCPNGCGRNLYSFFTVGRMQKKSVS